MPLEPERLRLYADHMRAIAEYEVRTMPSDPQDALDYAVAGTVLYEPILLALRRIALQELSIRAHALRRSPASPGVVSTACHTANKPGFTAALEAS
jgi:hypothetical protein